MTNTQEGFYRRSKQHKREELNALLSRLHITTNQTLENPVPLGVAKRHNRNNVAHCHHDSSLIHTYPGICYCNLCGASSDNVAASRLIRL